MIIEFDMMANAMVYGQSTILYIGDLNNTICHLYFKSKSFDLVLKWINDEQIYDIDIDIEYQELNTFKIMVSNDLIYVFINGILNDNNI